MNICKGHLILENNCGFCPKCLDEQKMLEEDARVFIEYMKVRFKIINDKNIMLLNENKELREILRLAKIKLDEHHKVYG